MSGGAVVNEEAAELDADDRAWLDERMREYREPSCVSTTIEATLALAAAVHRGA